MAIPLSPFTIPDLITIEPHLDFGVGASAGPNAKGNAYAGTYLMWPAMHAQLNLCKSPQASTLIPQVVPECTATEQVTMPASVFATAFPWLWCKHLERHEVVRCGTYLGTRAVRERRHHKFYMSWSLYIGRFVEDSICRYLN